MKKTVMALAILGAVSGINARAEKVGTVTQALYEQCAVITNLREVSDPGGTSSGGCGSGSSTNPYWEAHVEMSVTAALESGKTYDVVIKVINQNDEVEEAFAERHIYTSYDKIYHADGLIHNLPARGNYQVNLSVVNATTGVTVCTAQSPIRTAK